VCFAVLRFLYSDFAGDGFFNEHKDIHEEVSVKNLLGKTDIFERV